MPTTAERLQALVQAEKQRRNDRIMEAESARAMIANKRRSAAAQAQASAAAAAAAAAHAALKASTFRMPDEKAVERRSPRKPHRRRPASAERTLPAKHSEWREAPTATGGATKGACEPCSSAIISPDSAIFVHFIPPPLRARDKPDLSWIVHTCNGSGCREARHVSFHSITGFSTFEGTPPEVASGLACGCQIANHHLRGHGTVRWEDDHAIVEDEAEVASIDARAYMTQARRLSAVVASSREQIKALRASEAALKKQVETLRVELAGPRGIATGHLLGQQQQQQQNQVARQGDSNLDVAPGRSDGKEASAGAPENAAAPADWPEIGAELIDAPEA